MTAQDHRLLRRLCSLVFVVLALALLAAPSWAVILQPDAVVPTDRPPDAVVGRFADNASCVVIGTEYILTTRHQIGSNSGVGFTVEVAGTTYTITDANNIYKFTDPNVPDMMIVRFPGATFPQYVKVNSTPDELTQTVVIGGYGRGAGDALHFNGDPHPFGYAWDANGNTTLRWGQNRIDSTNATWDPTHGYYTNLLEDDFDEANKASAVPGEAAIAEFDSGCGWFRKIGSDWYVVALGWGLDHPETASSWYDDPNRPLINPDHNYAVRLSDYATWINGVIPEPASLAILAAGAAILIARRRRSRV